MGKIIQPINVLTVWVTLFFAILLSVIVTGNFKVNNSNHTVAFGVYDNLLAPAARMNVAWETIGTIECLSLVLLPVVLLIGRRYIKQLRDIAILPWLIGAVGVLFALFMWPMRFGYDTRPFDPFTVSELSTLIQMQIPIVVGVVVGVLLTKKSQQASGKVSAEA